MSKNKQRAANPPPAPFKSHFEAKVAENLKTLNTRFDYEAQTFEYVIKKKYTPDFVITREDGSSLFVETKGHFGLDDRQKMLAVKDQHPDIDIAILFMRDEKIRKGSPRTYSDWAKSYGFKFAVGDQIPDEWLAPTKR